MSSFQVDVNHTIDDVLSQIRLKRRSHNILVINQTQNIVRRVGAYNDSGNWAVGDVEPNTAELGEISYDSFSVASNYKIGDGKFFQFVATFPRIGQKKIGLSTMNEDGNGPAKNAWDRTNDSNDKSANNPPYEVRAFISVKDDSNIWVYQVKKV